MQDETLFNGKKKKSFLSDNRVSVKVGDAFTYKQGRHALLEGAGNSIRAMKETVDIETSQYAKDQDDVDDSPQTKNMDVIASYYSCKNVIGTPTYPYTPTGISEMLAIMETGKIPASPEE